VSSNAFSVHLEQLLADAKELQDAHTRLKTGEPGRQYGLASLNRSTVIISVSAWESYVEELLRDCLQALRPPAPLMGAWPTLNAHVLGLLARFHTPNAVNVANLIHNSLGLPDIRPSWGWQNCTSLQAEQRLDQALTYRHEIAHGVNPRPNIDNLYASRLPGFVRRLARCTDDAVRHFLVNTHGIANPWPP
jgi:hypothetical protein